MRDHSTDTLNTTPSPRRTVALIYDFDGTLSPANMQEYGLIQAFGSEPAGFWQKCDSLARKNDASEILCYMRCMLEEAEEAGIRLTQESFRGFGAKVRLYPGVEEWFSLINAYGASKGLEIQHFIDSSGLTEIIEGTSIYKEFRKVFACKYLYDDNGCALWPGMAVDYTTKTQFMFKINKGILDLYDHSEINRFIPWDTRPVPFRRMIYIGDGTTDIPCMKLIKAYGGHSIAVHNPDGTNRELSERLLEEDRVNFVRPADYREGGELFKTVLTIIDKIRADLGVEQLSIDQ